MSEERPMRNNPTEVLWEGPRHVEFHDIEQKSRVKFEFDDASMDVLSNESYEAIGHTLKDFTYELSDFIRRNDELEAVGISLTDVLNQVRDNLKQTGQWVKRASNTQSTK